MFLWRKRHSHDKVLASMMSTQGQEGRGMPWQLYLPWLCDPPTLSLPLPSSTVPPNIWNLYNLGLILSNVSGPGLLFSLVNHCSHPHRNCSSPSSNTVGCLIWGGASIRVVKFHYHTCILSIPIWCILHLGLVNHPVEKALAGKTDGCKSFTIYPW